MKFPILQMMYLLCFVQISLSVSVYINMSSFYNFPNKVMKADAVNLNGIEFALILFDNGTISKLNSQLTYLSTIKTLDSKKITDFSICNSNYYPSGNSPSIMALINGSTQWKLISLQNNSIQFSFVNYTGLSFVFGEAAYFNATTIIGLRAHVYYQDVMIKINIQLGNISNILSINFTRLSTREKILKVIQVRHLSKDYLISLTTNHRVTLFSVQNSSIVFQEAHIYPYNSAVDQLFADREIVAFTRHANNDYYAKDMLSKTKVIVDSVAIKPLIQQVLKGIRPRYDQYGERFFITSFKSFKINLTANDCWKDTTLVQSNLNFDTNHSIPIGFVLFSSSNSSFLYQSNNSTIYAYCQSMQNGVCINNVSLPCTLKLRYCQSCNANLTVCYWCVANYILVNNSCVYIISSVCSIANCVSCYINNNTCVRCANQYNLNTVNNECILSVSNQTNNQNPNGSNSTINQTSSNSTKINQTDSNQTSSTTNTNVFFHTINETDQNQSQYQNTQNSTANISNSAIDESTLNYTIYLNNLAVLSFDSSKIQQLYLSYNHYVKTLVFLGSILNSSPIIRIFIGFLSPFFGLFDDYWFYVYHQNDWKNLIIFPDFLVCMYLINKDRMLPDYLRFTDKLTIQSFQNSDYYIYYTNKNIMLIDEQITYAQNNFEELILQQFPILIVIFILIKLLTIFIRSCVLKSEHQVRKNIQKYQAEPKICVDSSTKTIGNTKNVLIRSFTEYLEDCISFRSIITTFFGSNIIYVSFQLSSQLKMFFSFKPIDTVNLILAIFFGMIFIISFLVLLTLTETFYPSIKTSTKDNKELKKAKEKERVKIKYGDFNFFVFNGIKCSLYGFIHGYFINQNQLQYILLILVKFVLLIIIIRQTKLFEHSALAIFAFVYYSFGILIDTLCLLEKFSLISKNFPNIFQQIYRSYSNFNVIELMLLVGLVTSIFGGVFFQFGWDLKVFLCPKSRKEKIILQIRTGKLLSFFHKVKPLIEAKEFPIAQKDNNDINQEAFETGFYGPKYCFRNKLILNEIGKKKRRQSFVRKFKGLKARKDELELRSTNKKSYARTQNSALNLMEKSNEERYENSMQRQQINMIDLIKTKKCFNKVSNVLKYDGNEISIHRKSLTIKKERNINQNLGVRINILRDNQRSVKYKRES